MEKIDDFLILGFTGAFCSGCTTAAKFFENLFNKEKNKVINKKDEIDSKIADFYKIHIGGNNTQNPDGHPKSPSCGHLKIPHQDPPNASNR